MQVYVYSVQMDKWLAHTDDFPLMAYFNLYREFRPLSPQVLVWFVGQKYKLDQGN